MFRALLSEAYLVENDIEQARAVGEQALDIARTGGFPVAVGYAERAVGRLALATGKLGDAEAALERARQTFLDIEARAQAARSQLPLAEVRAARSDRDAAATDLRTAQDLFVTMRAPRLAERTQRLAERLGLSLEPTMTTEDR